MTDIGIDIGIDFTAGRIGAEEGVIPSSSPNLLTAPEAFDNAAWLKVGIVVTPDVGDPTFPTADQAVIGSGRALKQTTSIGGTTFTFPTITFGTSGAWERQSITGTVDGINYTFSCASLWQSGTTARLAVINSGGFAQVQIQSVGGAVTVLLYGATFRQESSFSGYP
jgi:hypothetical protein